MDNLRKVISSAFNTSRPDKTADMLITNVLNKYGVSRSMLQDLTPQQKEKIRRVTAELQSKIDDALQ